jgi:ribokinase
MRTEQGVKMAVRAAAQYQPDIAASVTCGKQGSWVWDGHDLHHVPALVVDAVNTAGAGDAHLAGLLVGLAASLSLCQAHELAALVAALSVLSLHTIHPTLDRVSLKAFVDQHALRLSDGIAELLGGGGATQDP